MKAGRLKLKERRPFRSGPRAAQVIAIAVEMLQGDIAFGGGRARKRSKANALLPSMTAWAETVRHRPTWLGSARVKRR